MLLVSGTIFRLGENSALFPDLAYVCDISIWFSLLQRTTVGVYRRRRTAVDDDASLASRRQDLEILVQLCAKHAAVEIWAFSFDAQRQAVGEPPQLTVSATALKDMLDGSSPHRYSMEFDRRLSTLDQWQALAMHCPEHIQLSVENEVFFGAVVPLLRCNQLYLLLRDNPTFFSSTKRPLEASGNRWFQCSRSARQRSEFQRDRSRVRQPSVASGYYGTWNRMRSQAESTKRKRRTRSLPDRK